MSFDFHARVTLVLSNRAARVWREPDAQCPEGRAYGLPLTRVVDEFGQHVSVTEGDALLVRVEEDDPDRIVLARFVTPVAVGASRAAYA